MEVRVRALTTYRQVLASEIFSPLIPAMGNNGGHLLGGQPSFMYNEMLVLTR